MKYLNFIICIIIIILSLLISISLTCNTTRTIEQQTQSIQELPIDIPSKESYTMSVPLLPEEQSFLLEICQDTIFSPQLIVAIISIESKFIRTAYSPTDDIGYMQIHKAYYPFFISCNRERYTQYNAPIDDWYNYRTNIITGINALEHYANKHNTQDYRKILAHYNGGNHPNYKYADKVLKELYGI